MEPKYYTTIRIYCWLDTGSGLVRFVETGAAPELILSVIAWSAPATMAIRYTRLSKTIL